MLRHLVIFYSDSAENIFGGRKYSYTNYKE